METGRTFWLTFLYLNTALGVSERLSESESGVAGEQRIGDTDLTHTFFVLFIGLANLWAMVECKNLFFTCTTGTHNKRNKKKKEKKKKICSGDKVLDM